MSMEKSLIMKFGPLMTLVQLAGLLSRAPEGLRVSLRNQSDWSLKINSTKLKIGRRVYFKTMEFAQVLDQLDPNQKGAENGS